MNFRIISFLSIQFMVAQVSSQNVPSDSSRVLRTATVEGLSSREGVGRLEDIHGMYIMAGKKSEVISLSSTDMDVNGKTGRQIFAKVPGIFVYNMDGAANQINISARGLDPHRGWEFNLRKDGVMTNSDMYGYPASHYSMPLESIDKIEIVRGTASLQYGAQFGGMINYVSKVGDTTKPLSFESFSTVGSYGLVSVYNALSGKKGKFRYYMYDARRKNNGYRQNEHSDYDAQSITLEYFASKKVTLRLEWSRSNYIYRIPGPLSDSMYYANPTQSTRSRNYFNPDIHVPSFRINWNPNEKTKIQFQSTAVLGVRSSVQFNQPVNIADTISAITLDYDNRQVDIDRFHSFTQELRILRKYSLGNLKNTLVSGAQLMTNDLHRTQLGKGTTGSDFNVSLVDPQWGRDMHFITRNIAIFAENNTQISKSLSIHGGFRVEDGQTNMTGTIVYYPSNEIPLTIRHHFPLFGAGFSYKKSSRAELYGGWSQAYRPMVFKDVVPASYYEKVNPGIQDARGGNMQIGYRGKTRHWQWDITAYELVYNNRFGTTAQKDTAGNLILYRTNIGNSLSRGFEIFIQGNWLTGRHSGISVFTSTSLMDAHYTSGVVKNGNENKDVTGNKVESAPAVITRNGFTFRSSGLSVTLLYSYISETYADALNTKIPPSNAAVGLVPAYGLTDVSASWVISDHWEIRGGIYNLFNEQYFTKRPQFYPGPGVWPSYGRNFKFSAIVRI